MKANKKNLKKLIWKFLHCTHYMLSYYDKQKHRMNFTNYKHKATLTHTHTNTLEHAAKSHQQIEFANIGIYSKCK